MTLILGSLQLGFIYGLLALGIYLSFRILNIADLSAEGTFTLGLAVSGAMTVAGQPVLGVLLGMCAGFLAGMFTGLLQTKLSIHPILAGILTMSGLYSVNLAVMGSSSNLSLVGVKTLYRALFELFPSADREWMKLILSLFFCAVVVFVLSVFFKTHLGLCMRAVGDNEEMVKASSIPAGAVKILALGLSNGCIAFSGALLAQYQGFADISSGVGIVAVGLASVIIGERLLGARTVTFGLVSAVAGSLVYRLLVALALKTSLFPAYFLKLVSAAIVMLALSVPAVKEQMKKHKQKKGALGDA